ncbi:hypothetical protein [Castellaniella sp. GW247-6E4]|uniref:hypothetical protein n=1 Tax=Castellaniella sp. GW247-6E4 TaxID=3140380 RepID=UPI003314958B
MKIQHLMAAITLVAWAGIAQGADRTHAITPKPGAAVSVQLTNDGQLSTGVQTRLDLRFAGKPDSVMTVEYRTENGLLLRSSPTVQLRSDLRGLATDAPMVEAVTDGIHYLHVSITLGDRRRVVSIRVTANAGGAGPTRKLSGPQLRPLVSPGEPGVNAQGDPLVILPAARSPSFEPPR